MRTLRNIVSKLDSFYNVVLTYLLLSVIDYNFFITERLNSAVKELYNICKYFLIQLL